MGEENRSNFAIDMENYPILSEHPLQSNLLLQIPAKAQKGLSTFDIEFTCIDADGHYLVIGSNVGVVYLFDRIRNEMTRLRNDYKDAITSVKVIISIECLVVFGSKNGAVFVFKVPLGHEEEIEKFTVEGLHACPITSLEWVKNGMKFYSGDESGVVVCTEIDHFEHQCRSRVILNEPCKIIQLSYNRMHLVVSSLFRSLVYSCEDGSVMQIGQKERKCYGPFGAVISQNNTDHAPIYATRPGQRIWKSDKSGMIHETMIFKSALSKPHHTVSLFDSSTETKILSDFQFEKLEIYNEKYLLVSSDSAVLVIDPEQKCVIASCPKLDPVIDIAICNEEIFVLRGLRDLIRISISPDPYPCEKVTEEPSLIEEILVPFKGLSTFVKERSESLSSQSDIKGSTNNIFGWLRKKRSTSSPAVVLGEVIQNEMPQPLPDVVNLDSNDCSPVVVDKNSPSCLNEVPININITINENESDDIVYKPKKKKKKVRFRSVSPKDRRKLLDIDAKDPSETDNDSLQLNNTTEPDVNSNDLKTNSDEVDSITKVDEFSPETNSSQKENDNSAEVLNENNSQIPAESSDADSLLNKENDTLNIENLMDEVNIDSNMNILTEEQNQIETNCDGKSNDIYDIYTPPAAQTPELNNQVSTTNSISSDDSSYVSTDTELAKYGVDWLKYNTPEELLDLCVSNEHIFCVDAKNRLYYAQYPVLGLQWKLLDQPAERIAVSPTESIVWVLFKGTVYASLHKSSIKWKDTEWASIAREVVSISVDDTSGWYVSRTGHLTVQKHLSASQPFGYPESIRCDKTLAQVSAFNGVVWVLSTSGKLYFLKRTNVLQEIEFIAISDIDTIFLGVHGTGWIIDCSGVIRFITGVSPDSPMGLEKPWEMEASQYLVRSAGHIQQAVLKALNNEMLTSLIRGKQHVCLSTSKQGVWFCKTMDSSIFSNQNNIIGHSWEPVIPSGTASATKWKMLSASGVLGSQGTL